MKVITRRNDLTGEDKGDFLQVTIAKEGYMIEYPKGNFSNVLMLDIEEKDFARLEGKLKFSPMNLERIRTIEVK